MEDDVPRMLQDLIDAGVGKQTSLAKKLRVSQSNFNRWINDENPPKAAKLELIKKLWREANGVKLTLEEKIAPYDADTQLTVHHMVDNYLKNLPPKKR